MLLLDAIAGNNDRHFYNWGVIRNLKSKKIRFSPIYDSARALFWNESEEKLVQRKERSILRNSLDTYANNSSPKTGVDGRNNLNHFDLIRHISNSSICPWFKEYSHHILYEKTNQALFSKIDTEFKQLFSPIRIELITNLLEIRIQMLKSCIL